VSVAIKLGRVTHHLANTTPSLSDPRLGPVYLYQVSIDKIEETGSQKSDLHSKLDGPMVRIPININRRLRGCLVVEKEKCERHGPVTIGACEQLDGLCEAWLD
jgi:hypothetical protein